jgi:pSer/pThr/pTyr-binding forkhead associated (FHA) protein
VSCKKALVAGEELFCAACTDARETALENQQPHAAPDAPCLEIVSPPRRGQRVNLPPDRPLSIGRRSDQDIVIEGGRHVAREHATIARDANGRYVLTNLSPEGTFVNRRRIEAPEALRDGDRIGLGREEPHLIFSSPPGNRAAH